MNNPLSPTPFSPADEITSLNINDLDVAALQARLEMAVAMVEVCVSHKSCSCGSLASCGSYCT
jgi:hypothetical protein